MSTQTTPSPKRGHPIPRHTRKPPTPEELAQLTYEGEHIITIEYQWQDGAWRPHAVTSSEEVQGGRGITYNDFDWCRDAQTLCTHQSGFGPWNGSLPGEHGGYVNPSEVQALLWVRPGIGHDAAALRAGGVRVIASPVAGNPFDDARLETSTDWCTVCECRYPADEPCNHLMCGDEDEEFGCGWLDVDLDRARLAVLELDRRLDDHTREKLLQRLETAPYNAWYAVSDLDFRDEPNGLDLVEAGDIWLRSLGEKAKDAVLMTRGWLTEAAIKRRRSHFALSERVLVLSEFSESVIQGFLRKLPDHPVCSKNDRFTVQAADVAGITANDQFFRLHPTEVREALLMREGMSVRVTVNGVLPKDGAWEIIPGRVLEGRTA